jgi:hypothetical protein
VNISIVSGTGELFDYTESIHGQSFNIPRVRSASFKISTTTKVVAILNNVYNLGNASPTSQYSITKANPSDIAFIVNNGKLTSGSLASTNLDIEFNIDNLDDIENTLVNEINFINGAKISGNIAKLGKFTSLSILRLWQENESKRTITGDIIDFVNKQRYFNRTSAVITFKWLSLTNIKLHGAKIPLDDEGTLEWTANYIIVRGGTSNVIYSYGASAEQIAEWENDGYTVTQV